MQHLSCLLVLPHAVQELRGLIKTQRKDRTKRHHPKSQILEVTRVARHKHQVEARERKREAVKRENQRADELLKLLGEQFES